MKKIGIILGMLLLLLPLALAANSYDADFSEAPTHLITLNEGDEIRVFYEGTEHSVILDHVNSEERIVNLETFYDLKDYAYSILYEDIMVRMDIGKDGSKEVGIELYDMGENYATLLLTDLNYEEPVTTGNVVNETVTTDKEVGVVGQTNPWIKYVIFGVLIVSGILAFRLMKNNSEDEKTPEEKTTKIPDEVEEHEVKVESEEQDKTDEKSEEPTEETTDEEPEEKTSDEEKSSEEE